MRFPTKLPFALNFLWRDWRGGELSLLVLSLVVAVSTMTSISLFTSRIQGSMYDEASELLAADALISGRELIPETWPLQAKLSGLEIGFTTAYQAMTFAGANMQMASIKGVSDTYPLKGEVLIDSQPFGNGRAVKEGPARGEVWLASRLFSALDVKVGDRLDVGEASFVISAALIKEPDGGAGGFFDGARVMIHQQDVAGTGAIAVGSRVSFNLLIKGEPNQVSVFKAWLEPKLGDHHKWVSAKEANQSLTGALERAESFLLLAGSLSVILAGVAVALSARRYAHRQRKTVALLKTLGVVPQRITRIYLAYLVVVGICAVAVGIVVGWGLHWGILSLLQGLLPRTLVAASWQAYWVGGVSGFVALMAFAAPPLLALRGIPPVSVIRDSGEQGSLTVLRSFLIGFIAIILLVFWYSESLKITGLLFAGLLSCGVGVLLFAWCLVRVAQYAGRNLSGYWRLGLANLHRHRKFNVFQVMIFAVLMMLLFTLILVRTSLINSWKNSIGEDTPNHYVYNIYPEDKPGLKQFFAEQAIDTSQFFPITFGRVVELNGEVIKAVVAREMPERTEKYERELGLTWSSEMGADNEIVAGRWFLPSDADKNYVSLEEGYARGVGLAVGDSLTVSVSGEKIPAEVLSIRKVNWRSGNLNFFVIFNRPLLDGVGANWATSFHLSAEKKSTLNDLMSAFPTVTLAEVDKVIDAIRNVVTQVTRAIEFILGLIVIAGVLVLITGVQATLDERLKESAILRTLGASRELVNRSLFIEFGALGLIAGILATLGATLCQYFLYSAVFKLPFELSWVLLLVGPLIGLGLIGLVGMYSTRSVTKVPPLTVLRGLGS